MFAQAVGMTTSYWPVSHVVKTSQTIDLNVASINLSFTGIAVSRLILRLKAKKLCSGARNGKGAIPSAFAQRQPWLRSFKMCGISNALNGTEDDVICLS